MDVRPLKTEDDYNWAMAEITRYFENGPEVGSPDGDRFDILALLVEAYEDRHFPIGQLAPIDFLKEFMDMNGRGQKDLAELIGSRSRASEVLNLKRPLTLEMVHKISTEWKVPAELLVQPYELVGKAA